MVLSYNYAKQKRWRQRTNVPPLCRTFQWPCGGVEAIHASSPNAAWPGLHWKPLDAAIGRLLALYRPGGHQGDSKQNNGVTCSHFAGRFDGCAGPTALYSAHRPMEEVHPLKATKCRHWASTPSNSINRTRQRRLFLTFHREKGHKVKGWP